MSEPTRIEVVVDLRGEPEPQDPEPTLGRSELNPFSKCCFVIGIDDGPDLQLAFTLDDLLHDIVIHVL